MCRYVPFPKSTIKGIFGNPGSGVGSFIKIVAFCSIFLKWYIENITGADSGRGAPGARPLKLEENIIFWRKIVIFHTKYLPPLAAIFLSAPPLT
jgi:hypothetical protein